MSVESVIYISDLDSAQPPRTDKVREASDHLRNIKKAIKQTLPNVDGAVKATDLQMNEAVFLHRQRMYFFGQM